MNTKDILNNNNFEFKKKFGQNFLLDQNVLNNIIKSSVITKDTLVIEIGVGAGALTKKISQKAYKVLGYEIDNSLKYPLKDISKDYDNIDIVFDDFLKRNIKEDINKYDYKKLMVIANLPYYITTPIITKFIDEKIDVEKIIVMVQSEVADRFSAKPNTKSYNSLTVFLNYYFDIKKLFNVSKNVFYPRPNVDSAVVMFTKKQKTLNVFDESLFFKLIKDSFKQKRKNLKNNLKNYDLEKLSNILKSINKDLSVRAESLTINDFVYISNKLFEDNFS